MTISAPVMTSPLIVFLLEPVLELRRASDPAAGNKKGPRLGPCMRHRPDRGPVSGPPRQWRFRYDKDVTHRGNVRTFRLARLGESRKSVGSHSGGPPQRQRGSARDPAVRWARFRDRRLD